MIGQGVTEKSYIVRREIPVGLQEKEFPQGRQSTSLETYRMNWRKH